MMSDIKDRRKRNDDEKLLKHIVNSERFFSQVSNH